MRFLAEQLSRARKTVFAMALCFPQYGQSFINEPPNIAAVFGPALRHSEHSIGVADRNFRERHSKIIIVINTSRAAVHSMICAFCIARAPFKLF